VTDGQEWEGDAYDAAASHHRRMDDWFLDRFRPAADADVVDVGCGSGEFTARLAGAVSGRVTGVDPDRSMLEQARRHVAGNLSFLEGRAEDLDRLLPPRSADLVVSRATFNWIELDRYPRCFEAVRAVLRPGGWFHAEWAGHGNLRRLIAVLDEVAAGLGLPSASVTLADPATVHELLEGARLAVGDDGVRSVVQRRPFTEDELMAFVRTQAVHAYPVADDDLRRRFVAGVEAGKGHLRRADGSWDQTFVRLEVQVSRPLEMTISS